MGQQHLFQVVRSCLDHAASVAKTFVTSGIVVVEIKEPEAAAANPMDNSSKLLWFSFFPLNGSRVSIIFPNAPEFLLFPQMPIVAFCNTGKGPPHISYLTGLTNERHWVLMMKTQGDLGYFGLCSLYHMIYIYIYPE